MKKAIRLISIICCLLVVFNWISIAKGCGLRAAASVSGRPSAPLGVKNIVLVHGAFVDSSGWMPVYEILVKKGYHVTIVQHPLTSFSADLAAVERVISQQDGPCILVAHSYGRN